MSPKKHVSAIKQTLSLVKWYKWEELALISCCYCLTLLPPFVFEWRANYSGVYYLYSNKNSYGIDTALIIILVSIALACLTQYWRQWERKVFSVLVILLSLFGITATAHVFLYDAPISVGAIDALLGSDLHEALEYVSLQLTPPLLGLMTAYLLLVCIAVFVVSPRLRPEWPCPFAHGFAYSVVFILMLLVYQYPGIATHHIAAMQIKTFVSRVGMLNAQVPTLRIMEDINQWREYRVWLKKNEDKRFLYDYHATLKSDTPRVVVVVIGESMRRSNLSLYGYDKKTTPKLDKRRGSLLLFRQAVAPANQTVPSVTKLLSPATVQEPDRFLLQPSVISAAKQAGYKTYWLSNQGRVGQFDSMISLFAHEADINVFTNTEFYGSIFDEALLDPFATVLKDAAPLKFVVIHIQGSHQDYKNRYPEQYKIFNATQYNRPKLGKSKRKLLAEYDNTILHTDALLDNILAQLEKYPNTTLLYLSDHGERFYENGVNSCGHGYPDPSKTEVDVPYFIWCKGGCKKDWQEAYAQHKNTVFSTEHLFYTTINLLDLSMQDYQADKDILSKAYKTYEPVIITTDQKLRPYHELH